MWTNQTYSLVIGWATLCAASTYITTIIITMDMIPMSTTPKMIITALLLTLITPVGMVTKKTMKYCTSYTAPMVSKDSSQKMKYSNCLDIFHTKIS